MQVKLDEGKIKIVIPRALMQNMFMQGYIKRVVGEAFIFEIDEKALEFHIESPIEPKKAVKVPSAADWIDEYQDLFPKGMNSHKKIPFKGNRVECIKKMDKFLKDYKYSKELILEATKMAIRKSSEDSHAFLRRSDYFIDKRNAGSDLANFCQLLDEGEAITKTNITAI